MFYLIWNHTLDSKSYYEVRLNNFYSNYHYATPDVEDRDGDGDRDEDLEWNVDVPGPHPIYREREENYWWVLGDDPGYRDQNSWTHSLKADYVNQFNANNLLKAGILGINAVCAGYTHSILISRGIWLDFSEGKMCLNPSLSAELK